MSLTEEQKRYMIEQYEKIFNMSARESVKYREPCKVTNHIKIVSSELGVKGKEVENLLLMTRFEEEESVDRFGRKLRGMGVEEALEKAGAQRGDEVQILDYIFEFKE